MKWNYLLKKRVIIPVAVIIYIVAKVFVTLTPTSLDDDIPDQIKNIVSQSVAAPNS